MPDDRRNEADQDILEEDRRTELDHDVPEDRRNEMEAVAAQWVSRLSGDPLRPDERRDLDRWLAEHPDHQAAFDYARTTWADLGMLRSAPGSLADDVVPAPTHGHAPAPYMTTRRRPHARRTWMGALAACLVLAVGLGAFWFGDPVTLLRADYRTAPAETRSIVLPDGSTVDLGPASAMALRFDDRERRIELLSGTLYIAAAPMAQAESRPVVVAAADGAAKALGTQFMVDKRHDAVQVTVVEHHVEVTPAAASGPSGGVVLRPGQSVRYHGRTGLGPVQSVALDTITAWRRGRLIFDRVPLGMVVAELNRYRRGHIVIADPALAERRVSGMFETTKLEEALDSIVQELGSRKVAVPPFMTLLF